MSQASQIVDRMETAKVYWQSARETAQQNRDKVQRLKVELMEAEQRQPELNARETAKKRELDAAVNACLTVVRSWCKLEGVDPTEEAKKEQRGKSEQACN